MIIDNKHYFGLVYIACLWLLFYIGFILALMELIVFEISNVVFKLHCFFIELYKNIQMEEATKEEDVSDINDVED